MHGAASVGVLRDKLVLSNGLIMSIGHRIKRDSEAEVSSVSPSSDSLRLRANARNVSFRISFNTVANSHYQSGW